MELDMDNTISKTTTDNLAVTPGGQYVKWPPLKICL